MTLRAAFIRRSPPRLVVRTTLATFAVVACILSAVLLLIAVQGRGYVRATAAGKLAAGGRMLSALELRQSLERRTQVATLAENPTLKAALDTYRAELSSAEPSGRAELLTTIQNELQKLAARLRPDVLAVADTSGTVMAAAGTRSQDWPAAVPVLPAGRSEDVISLPSGIYRRVSAPIALQDAEVGVLSLATALDAAYARSLSVLCGANTLVVSEGRVIATTLPDAAVGALTRGTLEALPASGTVSLAGEDYAVQLLFQPGSAAVYALESIDGSAAPILADALGGLAWVAVAAFALAGVASLWMAQTLARPINTLSRSLTDMTTARSFGQALPATGSSREVDALTRSFNTMIQSVAAAETETRGAYVGAIRALALALDARDPYTAGHSERVSAIAVAVGRALALGPEDLETLRLGALLHDIGKIGISDNVLRKPEGLTADEFETIKEHPALGARFLRSVPFLAAHIPIVELHHERPDGRGYPYGLTSSQTPLLARIVHVADAFDAMTSARAYRAARPASEAVRELWRCAGTQFDAEVVQALVHALPTIPAFDSQAEPTAEAAAYTAVRRLALVARG